MKLDGFPSLGWGVVDWIEDMLVHGPGDVQGQPIILDDEFTRFVVDCYRIYPQGHARAGRRVRNRAFISRPKGRAKSELAGMIACAEGLGPVRFDGWDANGDPVGRPVVGPEILCFATEEDQAGNTYGNVSWMLTEGKAVDEYPGIDIGRTSMTSTRVHLPGNGVIEPVTSAASSKDGGKSTFVVWDEVHLWHEQRLRLLYDTVRRNLGKRKAADPWGLITSTMYRPGQGSVAEDLHADHLRNPDGALLFDHREGPECNLEDDDELLAALAYAYGAAADWMDLERIMREEFRSDSVNVEDSIRYFLNRRVDYSEDFLPVDVYEDTKKPRTVKKRTRICVGFDGSDGRSDGRKADSTVIRAITMEDGYLWTAGCWSHPEDVKAWDVPRDEVRAKFDELFTTFDVIRFYGDPALWQNDLDVLAGEHGSERVLKVRTTNNVWVADSLDLLVTGLRNGELSHDDDADARLHYANAKKWLKAAPKDDPDKRKELVLVKKPIYDGPLKIDTVYADALAVRARSDAIAAGLWKPKTAQLVTFR